MGSPSRFRACEPHMPFQCQSNAASSLINWLDFFTKTLKTATTLWLCQVIHNKAEWTKWEDILNTNASLPRDVYAGNMIIPTLDTVRWMEACVCKIWTLQSPSYSSQVPAHPQPARKPRQTLPAGGTLWHRQDCLHQGCLESATTFCKIYHPPLSQDMLNRKLDKEKFASTALFFTKITTPRTVQVSKLALLIIYCVVISFWFLDSGYHYEQA